MFAKTVFSIVLLSGIFQCNGHLGKLTGFLSDAHKHVHQRVQEVAGTLLGGLNVNIASHLDIGHGHERPAPQPQPGPTIVVIEKEDEDQPEPNGNGYGSHGQGNYGQGNNAYGSNGYVNNGYGNNGNQGYNNNQRPGYHQGQGQWNGNTNNNGNLYGQHPGYGQQPGQGYGNQNYGNQGNTRPGQNYGGYGRPEGNNQNYGGQNQNDYGQNQYGRPGATTGGYNNQNNGGYNRPQPIPDNNYQNHRPSNGYQGNNDFSQGNNELSTKNPIENTPPHFATQVVITDNPVTQKTTEKDEPLFIPLNPNEYVYGGDKITVIDPKRDTENKEKATDEDENLDIDIRYKDE